MDSRPPKEIVDPKEALKIGKDLIIDENKYTDAIPYFERAIELNPKYIDAWMEKGRVVRTLAISRWNEALACFDRAIKLTQEKSIEEWKRERFSGEVWYERGKLLNRIEKPEEAAEALREAVKYEKKMKKAGSSSLWYEIGCEFLILGNPKKSQDCFREALNIVGHRIRMHADGYQQREWLVRDITKTVDNYNQFLEAFSKATVLASHGKGQESLGYFDEAMKAPFRNASEAVIGRGKGAWFGKGTTLIRLGRFEEALKCFEDITRRFPFDTKGWLYKGELENKAGRDKAALDSFNQVIQLDPNLVKGWVGKAIILTNLKKGQEALMCIDRAIQLDPADAEILKTKEMIQQALGKG
jgi:tetratricopeptide (TPR) repeat protein